MGPPQAHDPPDIHPVDPGSHPRPRPLQRPPKGLAGPSLVPSQAPAPQAVGVGGRSHYVSQGSAQWGQVGLPQGVDSEGPSCPGGGCR